MVGIKEGDVGENEGESGCAPEPYKVIKILIAERNNS